MAPYALESLSVGEVRLDVDAGRTVTLNLNAVDRTDMTGTGPCNDFFGDWSHSNGRLVITGWQATDLDCSNEQAMTLETTLFEALGQAPETTVDLDQTPPRLVMTSQGMRIIWIEVPPGTTQPTRPPPFGGTSTTSPGGTKEGDIEASGRESPAGS